MGVMGRPKEWEDEDLLLLFIDADRPVLGTADVAEATGYKPQHAGRRLEDLRKRGLVDSHKVGQVLVWWITFEGRQFAKQES